MIDETRYHEIRAVKTCSTYSQADAYWACGWELLTDMGFYLTDGTFIQNCWVVAWLSEGVPRVPRGFDPPDGIAEFLETDI